MFDLQKNRNLVIAGCFLGGAIGVLTASRERQVEFSQDDIIQVEAHVIADLVGKGFTVDEIEFVKKTPTKLSGFARFHKHIEPAAEVEGSWRCEATIEPMKTQYTWRCAP